MFAAAKAGVTSATHTYNAMRGLHHREAGTLGGSMLADEISHELIADLVHFARSDQDPLQNEGKRKVVLVTDAIESSTLPTEFIIWVARKSL